jgi:cell wall-associated NlpC family hydrolase
MVNELSGAKLARKLHRIFYTRITMTSPKVITAFLILTLVSPSCIFVVHDKQKKAGATMDSAALYAAVKDSVHLSDSTASKKMISRYTSLRLIDTRNIHPSEIVQFAETLIGVPYRYGSSDPLKGFDCSGFISYVFQHFGINVPRSSIDFMEVGKEVTVSELKGGDLILFTGTDSTEKFAGHIGLVVSNQSGLVNFIHSSSGKVNGVTITPLNEYYKKRYLKTVRIFPQNE